MPREKRPLAEADRNAKSSKHAKISLKGKPGVKASEQNERRVEEDPTSKPNVYLQNKSRRFLVRKPSATYTPQVDPVEDDNVDESGSPAIRKETIDYQAKDDCKLRQLLTERDLSPTGTRADMITRLENTYIDYEDLLSDELTDMMRKRESKGAGSGTKQTKIALLRADDRLNWNRNSMESMTLYIRRGLVEERLVEYRKKLEDISIETYKALNAGQLKRRLVKESLSCDGSEAVMTRRLYNHDRKALSCEILKLEKDLKITKQDLETKVGHPISNEDFHKGMIRHSQEENEVQAKTREKAPPKVPICNYYWKDSHWANRTERELHTITQRREMPGSGPKAAMLKWLDTGEIEYEDMYVHALESMCYKRGISKRGKYKRADLAKILPEADEAENE
ncbi:hypothetical protein VTL71DRAFT_2061 [Oculimacula yallundae]|uniref:SAP domain-containing protein n=1 Tax=Oculimacula yallundae TaxID=86028 RepID=A0ABR4C7V0_9HELO